MINKMDSVLVVYVYTEYKKYCRFLYPKTFHSLTYKNKTALMVDEDRYPILKKQPTGEQVASTGRQIGIDEAKKRGFDWVFFLDLDTVPDPDCIEKLLAVKHPLVGGLHCARGNAWQIIGHNYKNRKSLERKWLKMSDVDKNQYVDGISGGTLLIAKGIFSRVDYTGYKGPGTIEGRHTADDEYLQIKIFESMKIRPKACFDCRSWHYHSDGRAFQLFGKVKVWRAY